MKLFKNDNCSFYVGCSARENWDLLEMAEPEDVWIHLADCSSSYVIIVCKEDITSTDVLYGCNLCKQHSIKRECPVSKTRVQYTEVKNVKKGRRIGEAILSTTPFVISV